MVKPSWEIDLKPLTLSSWHQEIIESGRTIKNRSNESFSHFRGIFNAIRKPEGPNGNTSGLCTNISRYSSILHPHPSEAFLSYTQYIHPKLMYPLSCTSLTPAQCRTIQAPALAALLPKLHLDRHSPHAVIFASTLYGGLGLPDLYIDQGFSQLTLFIGHVKLNDEDCNKSSSTYSSRDRHFLAWKPSKIWIINTYQSKHTRQKSLPEVHEWRFMIPK